MSEPTQLHAHLSPLRPLWRLKAERERRGWSQQELAERLNTTTNSVSRWERGISSPGRYFRRQLCDLFGRSLEELGLADQRGASGDHAIQTDPTAPVLLPDIWHVPFQRNPFFTGREQALQRLQERLRAEGRGGRIPQALCGLAGMGKTQTVVEYCYRFAQDYQAILWVRAERRETLVADLVTTAILLGLVEPEEQEQSRAVEAVKSWLRTHHDWLLVLDNLEDLNLIGEFIPSLHQSHVLLTMRRQATGTLAQSIELRPMSQEEAALFLLRRARLLPLEAPLEAAPAAERACAVEIAHLLDGLPLALDQAGAYIEETACGLSGYLNRYHMQRIPLLRLRGGEASGHPASLATTLALVIAQVEARNANAGNLLQLCAFLQSDAIPEAMITEGASGSGSILEPLARDACALDAAIKVLRDFSLIQRHAPNKTLSLHRLVQVVLQDRLDEQARRQWAEWTVELVSRAFPDSGEHANWSRCQQYLPQAQVCSALIEQWEISTPEAGALLLRAGAYLQERVQYTQAESLLLKARDILLRTLGEIHADYAQCLNELALLYHYWGRYEQAEALYRQALHIREQLFGTEHMTIAESLNNLGGLFNNWGQYAQAEVFYHRSQLILEKLLGPDDPLVVHLLHNVGAIHWLRGQYTQAESLLLRAVRLKEQLLGPEHPRTLSSLSYLAAVYASQQRYAQAETLQHQVLALQEQQLGAEHAEVGTSLYHLALMYHDQGQYAQAEELYRRALTIRERALGPEHPRTAQTLNGLARLYSEQGQDEQAQKLCQRALAIQERTLGPEHPDYADSLATLAMLSEHRGDESRAMQLYRQTLSICEGALEPEHPLFKRCQAAYDRLCAREIGQPPASASLPSSTLDQEHASEAEAQMFPASTEKQVALDDFLVACCERHPCAWCRAADLWSAYQQWVEQQGERFPLSRRAFAQALQTYGCSADRTNAYRIWRGITLRNPLP
jgi:tetratricopeptide (TPR) repeat protein/DNA-binding XRE family transcriptional regulator